MAITRSVGAFIGMDETTGQAVANSATVSGSEIDLLGDNASVGDVWLYAVITSTVTSGSIDITLNNRRVSGQAYARPAISRSVPPMNGTQKVPLGKMPASRYMAATVTNNATGVSATVALLYELEKYA